MPGTAVSSAVNAFGGWSGILAFYIAGLAFPLCYALRTLQPHSRSQFQRQRRELRTAGFIILFSALLCFLYPSEVYLHRHVPADRQILAHLLDWSAALVVVAGIAPRLGLGRTQANIEADKKGLALDVPTPRPNWRQAECAPLVYSLQARCFAESTWLLLTTFWYINISGGLLTVCTGILLQHEISWWLLPLCNTGGHFALLHAMIGVIEAGSHPFRVETMETALQCETLEAREAFWGEAMRGLSVESVVARFVRGEREQLLDVEQGHNLPARRSGDVSASDAQGVPDARPAAGVKAARKTGFCFG